jgi:nucleoside-diphosphate-sugar epimerase
MQAVIPKLIDKGYEVQGADNLFRHGKRSNTKGYTFHKTELTDRRAVAKLLDKTDPEFIIQGAARIYGVGGFNRYCGDILGEDLALHSNILKESVNRSVSRVVYISSSMVYETIQEGAVKEKYTNGIMMPWTDYGLSKIANERMSEAYERQYGLDYTIWRPFNIVAPSEIAEEIHGDSHVFADLIKHMVIERRSLIPIIGDGNQVRCYTHIDDVSTAIAEYSFDHITENQTYNIGNREPMSVRDLAALIHDISTKDLALKLYPLKFKTVKKYKDDVKYRVPDVSKAKRDIGWKPTKKTRESIRECIERALL